MKISSVICFILMITLTPSNGLGQVTISIVSSVDGWESLLDLASTVRSQEEVRIRASDLDLIKKLMEDVKAKKEFSDYFSPTFNGAEDLEAAKNQQFLVRLSLDEYVRRELEMILDPDQLLRRRRMVLRRKFFSPSKVFDAALLKEIGLAEVQLEEVIKLVTDSQRKLFKSIDELRSQEISRLLAQLPARTKGGFVDVFGDGFFAGIKGRSAVTKDAIQLFQEDNATQQLRNSSILMLDPSGLKGTQQSELLKLRQNEAVRHAQNLSEHRNRVIDEQLDFILTSQQRVALLQAMHRDLLKVDLRNLLRAEISKYVGLSDEELVELRELLDEPAKNIDKTRRMGEKQIYDVGVQSLPSVPRQRFEELMDGVWDDWYE